jgi:hypothetical protein
VFKRRPSILKSPWRSWISVALLLVATEAVYVRPAFLNGGSGLLGLDYYQLHTRRIAFAREALFGPRHTLPGWYPHELLGAPFAANLQNFPLIPTRLILLLLDPSIAYGVGVAIAAALAALFTYLYCRRLKLSEVASVAAGWTFACAGYFACRVTAGHLPLLEAYPALPLLLWLAERSLIPRRRSVPSRDRQGAEIDHVFSTGPSTEPRSTAPSRSRLGTERSRLGTERSAIDLLVLAIACGCVALAGHPQVPAYALATAFLYVIVRGRGWRRVKILTAMALGIGMTLAAWWPMLLLIQRSTRVLHLAAPENDISMPYGRLLALVRPGIDGWPDSLEKSEQHLFGGYPNDAYFWDTTAYVGILPLIAIAGLLLWRLKTKRLPDWPWSFLAVVGFGALLLALPLTDPLHKLLPGTFLRSPSRLLYLSTFSACMALGAAIHALQSSRLLGIRAMPAVVAALLLFHFVDLGRFAHQFVLPVDRGIAEQFPFAEILSSQVKDARVAVSGDLISHFGDRYDDIGVFDSILLANPYREILRLNGDPPTLNVQRLDGSELSVAALRGAGVRFVLTTTERPDLFPVATAPVSNDDTQYLYRVPDPAPRARFVAGTGPEFLAVGSSNAGNHDGEVVYSRPSSDEIRIASSGGRAGFACVLEAYDPGWKATVDGAPAPVVLANGFTMAVPVGPGRHNVALRYETPGRRFGWALSLLSAGLLAGLVWRQSSIDGRVGGKT